MTNEQRLKKAIEKVVKGGFDKEEAKNFLHAVFVGCKNKPSTQICLIIAFIFSPDFAKTYWGEEEYKKGRCCEGDRVTYGKIKVKEGWQYHQHKMLGYVQEGKEPLKYLEKFLK